MKKIHRRQLCRGRAIRHCVEQSALQSPQPIIIISIFTLVCLGNWISNTAKNDWLRRKYVPFETLQSEKHKQKAHHSNYLMSNSRKYIFFTVPHKEQQTSGRPITLRVTESHYFPPAGCIRVFVWVTQTWNTKQNRNIVFVFSAMELKFQINLTTVILQHLWHHFWQGMLQFFQKEIKVVAFL